jgi:hypothetical protein
MTSLYENEYLLTRCSICFDAQYQFCLEPCKDQYCYACFAKFIEEIVHNSWGMSVPQVKCPACMVHLPDAAWMRYVPAALGAKYRAANQPFRVLQRTCGTCDASIALALRPLPTEAERIILFRDLFGRVDGLLDGADADLLEHMQTVYYALVLSSANPGEHDLLAQSPRDEGQNESILALHHTLMPRLRSHVEQHTHGRPYSLEKKLGTLANISLQFTALEHDPEAWSELQFAHITLFPRTTCESCHRELCASW